MLQEAGGVGRVCAAGVKHFPAGTGPGVTSWCHESDVLKPSQGTDGCSSSHQLPRRPLGVGERTCHSIEATFVGKESTMGNYTRSYVIFANSFLWGKKDPKKLCVDFPQANWRLARGRVTLQSCLQ